MFCSVLKSFCTMFGFVRVFKRTRFTPGQNVFTQRFYINSKSAKGSVGVLEGVFVMSFITAAILGPAGWLLSNSSHYTRKK